MKRCIALLIAAALLLALALPALAEGEQWVFVNRDSLKIYEGMSKDTKAVKKLKGGTQVRVQGVYDGWHGVYYTDKHGVEQVGYAQSKYLSDTMPQAYCGHQWPEWTVTQQPTCTAKGEKLRQCPICGKVQTKEIKRLGHSYGEWVVSEEPACDAPGLETRQCERCGKVEEREIEPLPHEFGRWHVTEEATCTEPGSHWRECEECGYIEEEETELAEHTYGSWTLLTEPTCTSTGERVRWCVICGHRDAQTLSALPHEFGAWTVTRQPSCTGEGEQVRTCAICGTQQVEAIAALPHDFGDWTVTLQPTCTQPGARTRSCRMCGTEQAEQIAMLPHEDAWAITVETTDHSSGVRALRCANCGRVVREESFDPDGTLRKGSKGDAVRAIQQQLADQGYLTAGGVDGSYGGGTERALIQFQRDQGLEPDGVAWPQTQKRLRHDFDDWQPVAALTRDADGEYIRTCRDCGYAERRTVAAGSPVKRSARGEDVRAIQRMLNDMGYNAGTADGAYGPKLDAAYEAFAAENNYDFTPGQLLPSDVDRLVNEWIASVPEARWKGRSSQNSAVRLILTVTQEVQDGDAGIPGVLTYSWKLTNMGSENCRIDAVLLAFGEEPDFTSGNLAMAINGSLLNRNGGNSASGTFSVSAGFGEGNLNFCAAATSDKTGDVWLSNVKVFAR